MNIWPKILFDIRKKESIIWLIGGKPSKRESSDKQIKERGRSGIGMSSFLASWVVLKQQPLIEGRKVYGPGRQYQMGKQGIRSLKFNL